MKKLLGSLLILMMCLCLGGCMQIKGEIKIDQKGKVALTSSISIDLDAATIAVNKLEKQEGNSNLTTKESLWSELATSGDSDIKFTRKKVDGKDLAVSQDKVESYSSIAAYYKKNGVDSAATQRISQSEFRMEISKLLKDSLFNNQMEKNKDLLKSMSISLSVTFSSPVTYVDANGKVDRANPNRATWSTDYYHYYKWKYLNARCNNGITVRGITQGKLTNKTVKLSYSGVANATVNGKKLKSKRFSKTGKYSVILRAANGNQQSIYFVVDKKKPTVKGVKNGKTYRKPVRIKFSDANKIKSAKLDGKKTYTGAYVSKKRKHVLKVTDQAGNVSIVKFRVK